MGYTHYHNQVRSFTDTEWDLIITGATDIVEQAQSSGVTICGWDGTGEPELTDELISLNGTDRNDCGYETFLVKKNEDDNFNFCKTARKPYDSVVVSILAWIDKVAPGALELGSDGGMEVFEEVKFDIELPETTEVDLTTQKILL